MNRSDRLPLGAARWVLLILSLSLVWAHPLWAQTSSWSPPSPIALSLSSPVSLSEAVSEALAQHPRVRAALAQLRAAEAGLEATEAEIKGSLQAEGTVARRKLSDLETNPGGFPPPGSHGSRLSAALVWTGSLWNSPATDAALEAARAEVVRAQSEVRSAVQQVVLQTAQAYLNLLRAQDAVEVTRSREAWAAEALRVTQQRMDAGQATEADVLQAMAEWQQARADWLQALQGQQLAAEQLLHWMGRPPGSELPHAVDPLEGSDALLEEVHADLSHFLSGDLGVSFSEDGNLAGSLDLAKAVSAARARRSEVAVLEQQLSAARAALKATETERQPSVGVSASYRWPDSQLSLQLNRWGQGVARVEGAANRVEGRSVSERRSEDWTIALQVGWTLDDSGRVRAREAQGQARIQAVEASLEELLPGLRLEVETAVHNLRQALWSEQVAHTRLEASQSLLTRTEQLMEAGAASWSDVLQARFVAEGARAEWRSARWQRVVAQLNLAVATGWQPALGQLQLPGDPGSGDNGR